MIFKQDHIDKIIIGKKWQTRRVKRGVYQKNKQYTLKTGRGKPAVPKYRIVFDEIFFEDTKISLEDAEAEGGYTPDQFESLFREIYPHWNGEERWVFTFHVIRAMK